MAEYCLWLDDYRPKPKGTRQWEIAKSLQEFKRVIQVNGIPSFVSFDHDLNEKHYTGDFSDNLTGLDAIQWLLSYCKQMKAEFPMYSIHTMNVDKGVEMKQLLLEAARNKYVPCWIDYDGQAE